MASILDLTTDGGSIRFRLYLLTGERTKLVTVKVSYAGGAYSIRGWDDRTGFGTDAFFPIIDHEAPLNQALQLQVFVDGVLEQSIPVRVPATSPILTDPRRGRAIPVTIQSWPDLSYERAGTAVEISDSPYPVIIDGFERAASSVITIIHNLDPGSAKMLEEVLSDGSALRIRPACGVFPPAWVSVRGRRRGRFSRRGDSAIVDVMDLVHTGMPEPSQEALNSTLLNLSENVPGTLADINVKWLNAGLIGIALADLS